jgi:hypothetical protein
LLASGDLLLATLELLLCVELLLATEVVLSVDLLDSVELLPALDVLLFVGLVGVKLLLALNAFAVCVVVAVHGFIAGYA